MSRLSKLKFVKYAFDLSFERTFAKVIIPTFEHTNLSRLGNETKLKSSIQCDHIIPVNICRPNDPLSEDNNNYLSSSAILAIFDELSTYSLMWSDKTCRGGVSIHLSVESLKHVTANSKVSVACKADKIGKMVGFCTMELFDDKGYLVARGKHIKFMPMGFMYDFINNKYIQPYFMYLIAIFTSISFQNNIFVKWLSALFKSSKKPSPLIIPNNINELSGIFNCLSVQPLSHDASIKAFKILGILNTSSSIDHDMYRRGQEDGLFQVKVQPWACNYFKIMHGGAIAMSIEQACVLYRQAHTDQNDNQVCISGMSIRYLSPTKGDLFITIKEEFDQHRHRDGPIRTVGQIVNQKDGLICAEFQCHWQSNKSMK
eukprot:gene12756-17102_t